MATGRQEGECVERCLDCNRDGDGDERMIGDTHTIGVRYERCEMREMGGSSR